MVKISVKSLWETMSCTSLKVSRRFRGICRPHLQSHLATLLVYLLVYSFSLKMEAKSFPETSVHFQWETRLYDYIQGDSALW
jgi:hypothetical protein